jgi:hypothetical protein
MPEPSGSPTSSLQSVIDQLGALVIRHDAVGTVAERPVTGVVIDDPELGAPLLPGSAVLGVGAGSDPLVADLVRRATAAGAAAVFVKHRLGRADPPRAPGLAVVEVAADLAWEQLHVFARTALLHVGDARPGDPQTLFDVANAIAVRVDGAVVIEDEQLRVIAYSSLDHPIDDARRATILGRQIPERYVTEIREGGITAHLEGSTEPIRFDLEDPGMLPRLVVSLRSGGRSIGLLWAITDDEREADARRVLADAAPEVAAELLHHLTADASRATDRMAAASQLLAGRPVPNLRQLLGSEATVGFVVLALQPAPAHDAPGRDGVDPVGRAGQFAAVYVDAYRVPAVVASGPECVEIVVALGAGTPATRARELLDQLCARARATFGTELLGAMGSTSPDVRGLPASRRDAAAVLEVLIEGHPGATTAGYDEVQTEVALRELGRRLDGAEHLNRGPLPRLLASASKQDAVLVATVRTYLDGGGDIGRTAAALDVHRNTIRYRVDRFQTVTGIDLGDPAQRLVTQIQLTIRAGV